MQPLLVSIVLEELLFNYRYCFPRGRGFEGVVATPTLLSPALLSVQIATTCAIRLSLLMIALLGINTWQYLGAYIFKFS